MSIMNSLILRASLATFAGGSTVLWAAPQEGQRTVSSPQAILAWRIGRNEVAAIGFCRAYVEAQMQYAARDGHAHRMLEYAQEIVNSPGKKDGLFDAGQPEALLPKSFTDAAAVMLKALGKKPVPYHGYFFHILKSQGPDAPGGAMDYVAQGEMIGGFALVAWPAEYGTSGVQTVIVNHLGTVYEKDLGQQTATLAQQMMRFNPDKTWKPVRGE
jgi:Protein of unknown function (DUF2950)